MIFGVIAISSYLYPQMYSSGWQIWFASGLLPVLGLTIGYASSSIFCLPHASRRAIAIETGCQNVALCLTLVSVSYGADVFLKVLVFPALFGTLGLAIILVLVGLYHIHKILRRRLSENKLMSPDKIDSDKCKKDISYDRGSHKDDRTIQTRF